MNHDPKYQAMKKENNLILNMIDVFTIFVGATVTKQQQL